MELSETPRGRAWLANFQIDEQPYARMLLDGLDLVGQDRLRTGLIQAVKRVTAVVKGPVALVPVREMPWGQSYYKGDKNAKPQLLLSNSFPGSEAIIANLAGSLRRGEGPHGDFVAAPSLRNMRDAKCRTVIFLEDFSGSGDRIVRFHKSFLQHKTIRSWISYKLIKIHIVAFAMTIRAEDRLKQKFGEGCVHYHQICPTFSTRNWTISERSGIEGICRKYHGNGTQVGPYGFQDSRAIMAFSHSVPNNIPPILWQLFFSGMKWSPLFVNKAVPEDLIPHFGDSTPEERSEQQLARLGQIRLATGGWSTVADGDTAKVMLFLAALARRPRDLSRVSSLTGLSRAEMITLFRMCQKWGLVGATLRLTDTGLRELEHAKGIRLGAPRTTLQGSIESYYPRSLRVGQ